MIHYNFGGLWNMSSSLKGFALSFRRHNRLSQRGSYSEYFALNHLSNRIEETGIGKRWHREAVNWMPILAGVCGHARVVHVLEDSMQDVPWESQPQSARFIRLTASSSVSEPSESIAEGCVPKTLFSSSDRPAGQTGSVPSSSTAIEPRWPERNAEMNNETQSLD